MSVRLITAWIGFLLLGAGIAGAHGGGGGHGGHSGRSYSSGTPTRSHSDPSERTTHVHGYITKDGRVVNGYDRAPANSLPASGAAGTSSSHSFAPHNVGAGSVHASHAATLSSHFHAPFAAHTDRYAEGVARDARGRIERSSEARKEFERMTGYPNGRPGYVIDHIIPLKRGGPDTPSNMQWQTKEQAKAKDRWE